MKRILLATALCVSLAAALAFSIPADRVVDANNPSEQQSPFKGAALDTFELKADEGGFSGWHLILDQGDRMAVKLTPSSYPFTILEAAYAAIAGDYDEECKIIFYEEGTQGPGKEIKHKTVALDYAWLRWVDVSDLNVVIKSGSFYVAVELLSTIGPDFAYDCTRPLHHVSWFYDDGTWRPWENVSVTGMPVMMGDSVDMVLRVKGLAPGIGIVELGPNSEVTDIAPMTTIIVSSGTINYTLALPGNVEISLWDALGRRARTLYDDHAEAGEHTLTWDASELPPGTYFICLSAADTRKTAKVVLIE